MTPTRSICSVSVMDDTDPDIRFDANGVCQYVHAARRRLRDETFAGRDGAERLARIVASAKEDGRGKPYDCLIGLSGGVDSTYVALRVRELGLRPLAVHLDNGWNSNLAVSNMERTLRTLDIDLFTHVVNWEEIKDLQRAFFRASLANVEAITDHAITAVLLQQAAARNLRFIFTGSNVATESIMPDAWGYDMRDARHILGVHRRFGALPRLETFPVLQPAAFIRHFFLNRIRYVPLPNYGPYVKADAIKRLKSELGWQPYDRKHGESRFTRFFQEYYLPEKFGFDKRKAHFSSLIVSGQMTREEALQALNQPLYTPDERELDVEYVTKKLGFGRDEWRRIMTAPPADYRSFPHNAWMFSKSQPLTRFIRSVAKDEFGQIYRRSTVVAASAPRERVLVHTYFSALTHESRMMRAVSAALDSGLIDRAVLVGHPAKGLVANEHPAHNIEIVRVGATFGRFLPRVPARILGWIIWSWRLRATLGRYRPILIQAHGLASMPAAVLAKSSLGIPLIFDAHELETERQGWSAALKFFSRILERMMIGHADRFLVVSASIAAWYRDRYPGLAPVLVRNLPKRPTARPTRSRLIRERFDIPDDHIVYLYLGLLGDGRGIPQMIQAFRDVPADRHLILMGAGPDAPAIEREIAGIGNIHLHPSVPPEKVIETAAGADVGISLIEDTCLSYRFCLPNKLFECLHAGLPVIVSDLPEQGAFVRAAGCGWTVRPEAAALAALVRRLDPAEIRSVRSTMSPAPSWEDEAPNYLAALRGLIQQSDRSATGQPDGGGDGAVSAVGRSP